MASVLPPQEPTARPFLGLHTDSPRRSDAQAPAPDQSIGRFELRKPVGRGSTGLVYQAWDPFSGTDVALKLLDREIVSSPNPDNVLAMQFMKEASLVGKLCHPHIASILEASINADQPYVVMEYVPGGDLAQYSSPKSLLPVEQTLQVAFKTCGALDYVFKQGILHRDVKPANVLIAGGTNVKVADFGAAWLKTGRDGPAQTIGSPAYMSPEQLKEAELGPQSDMFSLGVLMYELLTGYRPFVGENLAQVVGQILLKEPAPPSTLRPGLEPKLDDMVLRMLAKNPADRHASWAELALDIAEAGRLSIFQQGIPDSEKFRALRSLPLLSQLDDAQIWELVHAGRWARVPPRTPIIQEDDISASLFFLAAGEVKVTKQGRLLSILSAGEYFGEMAYVKNGAIPRQASVEAITEIVIAEFDSELLRRTSSNCRLHLANALLDSLVDRLQVANDRLIAPKPA